MNWKPQIKLAAAKAGNSTGSSLRLLSLLLALLWRAEDVFAHADLEEQTVLISAQIAGDPTNATLFLLRADLHRRHAEFAGAHADVNAAERLRPDFLDARLERARIFGDEGNLLAAVESGEEVLRQAPGCAEVLALRGRCLVKLGRPEGIDDFSAAITSSPSPSPDLLLERANAQAAFGKFAAAIAGLDEGMARLGAVPALQLAAIELERRRADFDAALIRVDQVLARYPVKEPWLALRAEILEQAGRPGEAQVLFSQILRGLENYSPVRRGLELTRQLEARAREGLARVETKLSLLINSPPAHLQSALK